NRSLLGGFQGNRTAFDKEGNFLGDGGSIQMEIDRGLKIPINISTEQLVFGTGLQSGVNIIETIKTLSQALQEQDIDKERSSPDGFTSCIDQLSLGRTQIAGGMTEIHRALDTEQIHEEQGKELVAKIEEADPVKVFSDLARDQTVLKSALEVNRKVLNDDAMD